MNSQEASANEVLGFCPDPQSLSFSDLQTWLGEAIKLVQEIDPSSLAGERFLSFQLGSVPDHALGVEANENWRRFFLACLLADWASYERDVDRIDYARLKYILTSAYPWFRLYLARTDRGMLPVGYSAWYPLSSLVFDCASDSLSEIDDRGVFLPLRTARHGDPIHQAYVLNISIVPSLRNTPFAVRMLRDLHRDSKKHKNTSLLAVTVDAAGSKFSRFVGMEHAGTIKVQGETENLYIRRIINADL